MVSKQKPSLSSAQQRDYEPMMDGSVSCIASLQHTERTTQRIIPPKHEGKSRVLAENTHTLQHYLTWTFEITHRPRVLRVVCLLYDTKRENLISVQLTETKNLPESIKADL